MSLHHLAAAALVTFVATMPSVPAGEQGTFDPADRYLKEQSYSRSCEAFGKYFGQFPDGALQREAKAKRARACILAGKDAGKMVIELRGLADGGPLDLGRALANLVLAERGERNRAVALDQLEALHRNAGGRWAKEARALFIGGCFAEIERNSYDVKRVGALAGRILEANPTEAERARAILARARLELQQPSTQERAEKDLLGLGAGGTEFGDDALYALGEFRENRSELAKALEQYDAIVARFSPTTSNMRAQAASRAAEIRRPYVNLSVGYVELPGEKPQVQVSYRNLKELRYSLKRTDPHAQDAKAMLEGGEAGRAGAPLETVRSWTVPATVSGPYMPGSGSFSLDVPKPGAYLLEAQGEGVHAEALVLVTPLATLVKVTADQVLVWTVDALTGQAAGGAQVTLYTRAQSSYEYARHAGKSDENGLCRFELSGKPIYNVTAWASKDGGYAFARGYANSYGDPAKEVLAYVLSDRPLYKPGETVGLKVFLRSRQRGPTEPVSGTELNLQVFDAQNREIRKEVLKTGAFGTAAFELKLGKDAQLGAYRFYVRGTGVNVQQTVGGFRVEEYKPPEYTVKVEPVGKPKPGDPVKVKVSASFFFGGPVVNAQGRAIVTELGYRHQWERWAEDALDPPSPYSPYQRRGYDDVGYGRRGHYYQQHYGQQTLTFKTGADGTVEVEIPAGKNLQAGSGDRSYQLQVFITDASRREVTGAGTVNVSSQPYFADLRADRVLYKPGERIEVKLRAEDANSKPESPAVKVRLVRLGEGGSLSTILERPAKLEGGRGRVELDADAIGPVRIEVRAPDAAEGAAPLASTDVWLTNENKPIIPTGQGFQLITDKAPLEAGQKLRALVVTPTPGGHALLTIEGLHLHQATAVEVFGRARFVELPLTAEMTPNAWLSVSRIENLMQFHNQVPIRVRGGTTNLEVKVAWAKPVAEPGTSLEAKVTVAGDLKPTATEVSMAVVDEALLAIEPEKKDLLEFFSRRAQEQRVTTSTSFNQKSYRPHPVKQPPRPAEPVATPADAPPSPRKEPAPSAGLKDFASSGAASKALSPSGMAYAPASRSAEKKAKASADMDESQKEEERDDASGPGAPAGAAPVKVRQNFSSSAGWFPALSGSAPGAMARKVTLPDSLTTWRAIAVVVTQGSHLGVGRGTVRTEKPLMVRLQAPRFFTERDEVTLSAIVSSRLPKAATVDVSFELPGFKALDAPTRKVTVPAGGETRVDVRCAVVGTGERKLTVTARAPGAADAMAWTLPLNVHGSAQRRAFAGRLSDRFGFEVTLPERRNPAGTKLELTLSPSLLAVVFDGLPYLAQYPYGCVEQTLSRFVPASIAARAVKDLGLSSPRVPADLDDMVDAGLKRLYGFQHSDGGWGWWQSDPTNRWMSAYTVYGLSLGRAAGLKVDPAVLERGRSYLTNNLGAALNNPEEHAFMVFALAQTGGAPKAALDKVFERRTRLSNRGRALVALSLLAAGDRRARIAVENLDDIVKAAKQRADASVGEANDIWQTSAAIETTAYALLAMVKYDPSSPLVKPLTDFLVLRRNGGRWRNTRDTAFALYALSELAVKEAVSTKSGSFAVLVNGKEAARLKFTKGGLDLTAPVVLPDSAFHAGANQIEVRRDGGATGYYSALFDVYNQDENLKAVGNDVALTRSYTLLGKPSAEKGSADMEYGMVLESGDRVRVDLEVKANKAVEFLMVEDLKASGLEAVLQKSGPEVCNHACAHAELRTDRVAMFLTQIPVGVTKLSYELRAEVPGKFHALPARLEAMYAPELRATSDEMRLEVRDARGPGDGVAVEH
ncbi:MAG: alpha-2-macroglobulin family protein [Myxococcaceae bacterium]